jgi:pyridoxal phosphate enzyme (YggS family)
MTDVAANLRAVRERIARAAERARRDPSTIALLAVSKLHDAAAIRAAYDAGQRRFGENYAQELDGKREALAAPCPDIEWHFIGHLQRKKVKTVLRARPVVHTVDSTRLADELAQRTAPGQRVAVLLQVNVAREPQKSGVTVEELPALVAHVRALERLDLRGLMTIPPEAAPEDARPHFRALRELADTHALAERSIGMSADLDVAIEEGSSIVRVGTAIFGARA